MSNNFDISLSTILQVLILFVQTGILGYHGYLFSKQKEEAASTRKSGNFFSLLQYLENSQFNHDYLLVARQILEATNSGQKPEVDENALKRILQHAEVAAECYNNRSVDTQLFERIVFKRIAVLCKWVFEDDPKAGKQGHLNNMKLYYSSMYLFWQKNRSKSLDFASNFEFDKNGKMM